MSGDQQRGNLGRLTTASEEIGILTRGFEVGTVTQGVSGEMDKGKNANDSGMEEVQDNKSKCDGPTSLAAGDDVSSLQSQILHLRRENYLLKHLVNIQKDLAGLRILTTGSVPNEQQSELSQSYTYLPDIVLKTILKNIPDADQQTLLNCRLVCAQWNSMIEETGDLMKKIIFPVWHSKLFLDLAIVKKGKVKAIKFVHPLQLPLKSKYTETFIDFISKIKPVEKIEIAFEDRDLPQQNELFKLILENCSHLQELIVSGSSSIIPPPGLAQEESQKVFRGITAETNISAGIGLTRFSVNINGFMEEDANGFIELLRKLPKLIDIELIGYSEVSFITIVIGLCNYMKSYDPSALQLKKLSLVIEQNIDLENVDDHEIYSSLLMLCKNYSVAFDGAPNNIEMDFNEFLELTETPQLPSLQQRPLFTGKVNGFIAFDKFDEQSALVNVDRFDGLNIGYLRLIFNRDLFEGELAWINNLHSLEGLVFEMEKAHEDETKNWRLGLRSITEFEEVFSDGLLSVKELYILSDIFDSIRLFRWSQYFPNVVIIHFNNCQITPKYLISELVVLEFLEELKLENLPNLKDVAFTTDCVDRFTTTISADDSSLVNTNKTTMAPAISCFKSLKILYITGCPLLTDLCIINGISKCKTLKYVEIQGCGNISEKCCDLVWSSSTTKYKICNAI